MTEQELTNWITFAKAGDELEYHQGEGGGGYGTLGRVVRTACAAGRVFPYQRRLPEGGFSYRIRIITPECGRLLNGERRA